MAKVDKRQYSKEEWHRLRNERRQEKFLKEQESKIAQPLSTHSDKKYNVLCLKHGVKYSPDYVNKLYSMVKRNCNLEFNFWCLTENSANINPNVKILSLPEGLEGWWYKPYMFSRDIPINGTILYLDLDIVVSGNIDKLFTYKPGSWCTIRDFTRVMRPNWQKYNSSVVRYESKTLPHVWEEFHKNKREIQKRLHGDQDWLYEITKNTPATLYPDSWALSWKWEIRKSKEFAIGGTKGNRKLKYVEHVVPPNDCCITVFHGDPNPHNCDDPWVIENWK